MRNETASRACPGYLLPVQKRITCTAPPNYFLTLTFNALQLGSAYEA